MSEARPLQRMMPHALLALDVAVRTQPASAPQYAHILEMPTDRLALVKSALEKLTREAYESLYMEEACAFLELRARIEMAAHGRNV